MTPLLRVAACSAILLTLLLSACASLPPRQQFPAIGFTDRPPIRMDVAAVEVRQSYVAPRRAPNVEHLFQQLPAAVAQRWARQRIEPAGRGRLFEMNVVTASVIETRLPLKTGVEGLLTTEQAARYDATLVLDLRIVDDIGAVVGTAQVEAKRSLTVKERATRVEVERAWYLLTQELANDLDRQLEETVKTAFFPFVIL